MDKATDSMAAKDRNTEERARVTDGKRIDGYTHKYITKRKLL